jgi:NAD(P)-dependent dehydrogenase (short-subunit alcohol dehydrogenase family)
VWQRNQDILVKGYFLASRAAFRIMKQQKLGGSMVFVASKNGLVASAGASAYCTAKAAEIHLARCLALEGAPHGIRVNVVNPDAVIRGSRIWDGKWKQERAVQQDRRRRRGSLLPRPQHAETERAAGGYRRGGVFLSSDRRPRALVTS